MIQPNLYWSVKAAAAQAKERWESIATDLKYADSVRNWEQDRCNDARNEFWALQEQVAFLKPHPLKRPK